MPSPAARTTHRRICILRLSAIGDVAHTVAVVRRLQDTFPEAHLTWIVGRIEAAVAALVPEIEVVVVDKRRPLHELLRLRRLFRGKPFDELLHMQIAFRANLLSLGVPARRRWGFDSVRAKEGHSWVVNQQVPPAAPPGEHVLDGLMRFPLALGAQPGAPRWDLALPAEALAWVEQAIAGDRPLLAVNGCASRAVRDWQPERYAAVARHAMDTHGLQVVLCGGPAERERAMSRAIGQALGRPVIDLVGRTTLAQLLAVLKRSTALISPDSGPVHLATAVGVPVIGLYGVSNVRRTGPAVDAQWCVDRRDAAARRFLGRPASELRWSEPVPGGMDLIETADVIERLDALMRHVGTERRRS